MDYLYHRLPMILLFAGGYLLYSLFATCGLTRVFALRIIRLSRGKPGLLLPAVMAGCALMSFFIPNAVTMLAFLPLMKSLESSFRETHGPGVSMVTPLTLAAVYGANIGGMGSLIGSPANLLLIGALDYFQVPGREHITFFNWFIWSVPLVVLFLLAAWGVLLMSVPGAGHGLHFPVPEGKKTVTREQRSGAIMFGFFFIFWIAESILSEVSGGYREISPVVCTLFFCLFVAASFLRLPGAARPLLFPRDLVSGVPKRGLVLLAAVGVLIVAVRFFKLDEAGAGFLSALLEAQNGQVVLFFILTLSVIFLTEIFSNTVVSATFFSLAFFAASSRGLDPLPLMIGVSIASTCAFMTPIATPCNALAFGEMRGVSLRAMLGLGAVLNVVGAVLMTIWLRYVILLVYG